MPVTQRVNFRKGRNGKRRRSFVQGSRKVRKTLQSIEPEIRKGVLNAVEEGARLVQSDAIANVPVKRGLLRSVIEVRFGSKTKEDRKRGDKRGLSALIGVFRRGLRKAPYANRVEFGGKAYTVKKRHRHFYIPEQPAQPYLMPALKKNSKRITRQIISAVNFALKRVAKA